MELLTREEAEVLARARGVLRDIEDRAGGMFAERGLDSLRVIGAGRVAALAGAAENAVFDVVNNAKSHGEDSIAGEYIHVVVRRETDEATDQPDGD